MARIKPESVEAVKAAGDMLDVVGARTQLRKAGARYTGRCPFHEERTPSFSVNAVDKLYYCFGCGAGGDLISFVKETENLDFSGAVEWLADRFRVELEYEEMSPRIEAERRRRDRLGELLAAATAFYERCLWESSGAEGARAYLAGRGLGEEICRAFRLGFAPGGQTLAQKAREREFTDEELLTAGLVNRRGNDYFTQRIVFPLADARGRVLGFQARKLREDDPLQAKYVNSPESDLFQKGAILYGLDLARGAIAKQDRAVVVEGNTDVIALRQEGLEPVVASMGTALTDRHLRQLSRLTRNLWLCFDGDAAGEAATLRGMELAAEQGFVIKVVTLPSDADPADLAAGFEQRLAPPSPISSTGCGSRSTAPQTGRRRSSASGSSSARPRTRPTIRTPSASRPTGSTCRRTSRPASPRGHGPLPGRSRPRCSRRATGSSETRSPAASRIRSSSRRSPSSSRMPSTPSATAPSAPTSSTAASLPKSSLSLIAELDARAVAEKIDERTAKELLLRLTERDLRRQLARTNGDLSRTLELQEKLERVRKALEALS